MDILAGLDGLTVALNAAGVPASVEVSDLNLPGVWVGMDRITEHTLAGGGTLAARLLLIVPDNGQREAAKALSSLLAQVSAVVTPVGDITAETVAMPDGSTCPALAFTHPTPIA